MPAGGGGSLQLLFQINADDKGAEAALKKLEQELGLLQGSLQKLQPILQANSNAVIQYTVNTNSASTATKNFGSSAASAASQASGLQAALQGASSSFLNSAGGIQQIVRALGGLTGAGGGLATIIGQFQSLGAALGPVGLGVGAVASLGASLVELTNNTAKTGEQVLQLAQKTGLSTEAISGLRVAAVLTNTNIDTMATGFQRFRARIISAVEGVRDNRDALVRLGIDGPSALRNMDAALDTLLKKYDQTGDEARKAQILQDAFGARVSGQLTPIIQEAGGSLAALVKQAGDLNQVWSPEEAAKMDHYRDSIDRLSLAWDGLGKIIASKVVPAFTVLVTMLQQGITQPKTFLEDLVTDIQEGALQTGLFTHLLSRAVEQIGKDLPAAAQEGGEQLIASQKEALKRAELERKAQDQLEIEHIKARHDKRENEIKSAEEDNKRLLKLGINDIDTYTDQVILLNGKRAKNEKETAEDIAEIHKRQAKVFTETLVDQQRLQTDLANIEAKRQLGNQEARATEQETIKAANDKLAKDRTDLEKKINDLIEDGRHWAVEAQIAFGKAMADALEPPTEEVGGGLGSQIEKNVEDAVTALNPLVEKFRELRLAVIEAGRAITVDFAEEAGAKFTDASKKQLDLSGSLKEGFQKLAKQGVGTFAQGLGAVVHQWVILGTTGPAVMRKILAETLATLAEQAAVMAVYYTAYGFAKLAQQQYAEAGQAFTAAAIFAGVAVGSALIGRAIAPKQSGSATSNTVAQATPPTTNVNVGGAPATLSQSPGQAFGAFADSINKLNGKLDSMSPGDVVTKAADTTPGAFATGVTNATQKDGSFRRQLGLTLLPSS
jgi:hypothetical protein